jgi:hypothetical protein
MNPGIDISEILSSVAAQLMKGAEVIVENKKFPVKRVGRSHFRMVEFTLNGRSLEAIEQNPEKPSRWGQLARQKHEVVQFRDVETHHYIAVSVDGKIQTYGK